MKEHTVMTKRNFTEVQSPIFFVKIDTDIREMFRDFFRYVNHVVKYGWSGNRWGGCIVIVVSMPTDIDPFKVVIVKMMNLIGVP
jgi:hypothetical protein